MSWRFEWVGGELEVEDERPDFRISAQEAELGHGKELALIVAQACKMVDQPAKIVLSGRRTGNFVA